MSISFASLKLRNQCLSLFTRKRFSLNHLSLLLPLFLQLRVLRTLQALHPLWELDDQLSVTTLWKDLSDSQQSSNLKGFGPQSAFLDLSRTGQWSEKFLANTDWADVGHLASHSGETKNLSNLLLALPFGLNQVNLLPTQGASSTSNSSIQLLNSAILPSTSPLWEDPILSDDILILLKSPKMHQYPPGFWFFNWATLSHNTLFSWRLHEE